MRKLKRLIGSFLAAGMILSGIPVLPASAAEGGTDAAQLEGTGEILYEPDFSTLEEFDVFAGNNPGTWSASEDKMRVDGGTGNKAVAKNQEFTDFVYEVDITVEKQADLSDKSSSQGGIIFRVSQPEDGVSDGYYGC